MRRIYYMIANNPQFFIQKLFLKTASFTLVVIFWSFLPSLAQETQKNETIVIDGQDRGRTFQGIGAISAGGSSRLLYDYPEPERSQLLDYLFKPNYGAEMQLLKVEIGGDMNSTSGSEASHMRSRDEVNCNRGYEWWLMKEAKKRNPKIKLAGLAWGVPGWVGEFWSKKNIDYHLEWLKCAGEHGLKIDYMGGWNESGYNPGWFIAFDNALAKNYPHVQLIGADNNSGRWDIAREMAENEPLKEAVDIVGVHFACGWRSRYRHCSSPEIVQELGKPLWMSENSALAHDAGAMPLARALNRMYIDAQLTSYMAWSAISAWYANLPIGDTGLIVAEWPWSGYYDVGKSIWAMAHTTQFTEPGWNYLDTGSNWLEAGATYVSLVSPSGKDYSTIVEAMDLEESTSITFRLRNLPERELQLWTTDLKSDDTENHFQHARTIMTEDGKFTLTLEPGHLYTVSTLTEADKGQEQTEARVYEQLKLPFREDFEGLKAVGLARFFSDVSGAFEVAPCAGGRNGSCYQQVTTQSPVRWVGRGKMKPTTIMGDPNWWGDYEISTDILLEEPGYAELIGRIAVQRDTLVAGYHLQVNSKGRWILYRGVWEKEYVTLISGEVPFAKGEWHRIGLKMRGHSIGVLFDGKQVAEVNDTYNITGQVGLGVSRWEHAQFDNVEIVPTGGWPKFIPHKEMSATANSEHAEFYRGYIYPVSNAIDDRVETAWHSEWTPNTGDLPQVITLDLGNSYSVSGLTYRPNFIKHAPGGNITGYNIYLSSDGQSFRKVAGGKWPETLATKLVRWSRQKARYVRLEGLEGTNDLVSAGEINIIQADSGQKK